MWLRLMVACGCVEWWEIEPGASRPDDILKQVKPTLPPHHFPHNYVTLLYESGVEPLIAMKIVGHTDCQTTANIYMHLKEETLRRASVNMEKVFADREKGGERGKKGRSGIGRAAFAYLRLVRLTPYFFASAIRNSSTPCPMEYAL
mgnify:CR=1 FL=1|jgi:hypothetical protein